MLSRCLAHDCHPINATGLKDELCRRFGRDIRVKSACASSHAHNHASGCSTVSIESWIEFQDRGSKAIKGRTNADAAIADRNVGRSAGTQPMSGIGPCRTFRARLRTSASEWITDSVGARTRWPLMTLPRHARSSISHQHVLAPEDRTKQKLAAVVRQLLVRAAQRLRDDGFFCRRLAVEVKWLGRDHDVWIGKRTFYETQDTGVLLHILQEIWDEVPDLNPLRIGVALSSLAPEQAHQPDLFDKPTDAKLVTAVDELNAKFGKGAITYGAASADQTSKIAFQRVPRVKEF
jgi:hypothetical protein